jgi:dCMP deaminase
VATTIDYPYLPEGWSIDYVPESNEYIQEAKAYAKENSIDDTMPTGTVLVKDGVIIGRGANGTDYHKTHECERVKRNIPTGQGYELCEGCHPKNHSEPRAIADAKAHDHDTEGATAYLWGHWWCCEPCWTAMINAGISKVTLMEDSEVLFNKAAEGNIVGRQFEQA